MHTCGRSGLPAAFVRIASPLCARPSNSLGWIFRGETSTHTLPRSYAPSWPSPASAGLCGRDLSERQLMPMPPHGCHGRPPPRLLARRSGLGRRSSPVPDVTYALLSGFAFSNAPRMRMRMRIRSGRGVCPRPRHGWPARDRPRAGGGAEAEKARGCAYVCICRASRAEKGKEEHVGDGDAEAYGTAAPIDTKAQNQMPDPDANPILVASSQVTGQRVGCSKSRSHPILAPRSYI